MNFTEDQNCRRRHPENHWETINLGNLEVITGDACSSSGACVIDGDPPEADVEPWIATMTPHHPETEVPLEINRILWNQ